MALAADLTRRAPAMARKVLAGQEQITKRPEAVPSREDAEAVFAERLGDAWRGAGRERAAVMAAANALYAYEREPGAFKEFDSESYARALDAVAEDAGEQPDADKRAAFPPGEEPSEETPVSPKKGDEDIAGEAEEADADVDAEDAAERPDEAETDDPGDDAPDADLVALLEDYEGAVDAEEGHGDSVPDELVQEIGMVVLSVLPGTGEALSAKEAYDAFRAAQAALEDDDLAEALLKGGEAALAGLGAVPVLGGTVRLGRGAVKAAGVVLKLLKAGRGRATETAARAGRSVSQKWFGKWADNLLSRKVLPQGKIARLGAFSPEVRRFLVKKEINPGTYNISVIDHKLTRMVRDAKPGEQKLAADIIRRMPKAFRKPKAVLWDTEKKNLLYVFDILSDPRKGKYVVEVNISQKIQRGDKMVRKYGNYVQSGGRVPLHNLKDKAVYYRVEGNL